MKANVGGLDRMARVGAGVTLIGWCPAYQPLDISSCKVK